MALFGTRFNKSHSLFLISAVVIIFTCTADTAGQLDVLWHDGHTLGMDSTEVGILEESNKVGLTSFLESHDGCALETEISLEVLGDLTDETLEGQFSQEELRRFLVSTDLTEGNCSGSVTMRLLYSSGGRGALTGSLGSQLFTGCFSSCRFTGGLLCTSHYTSRCIVDK